MRFDRISCRKLHKANEYPHIQFTDITDIEVLYCNYIPDFPKSLKSFLFENFSADFENRRPVETPQPARNRKKEASEFLLMPLEKIIICPHIFQLSPFPVFSHSNRPPRFRSD